MDTVNKDKKERKVDFNLIADSGVADYSDGDIIVIDKLGVKPINENIKLDMILMVFCTKDACSVTSTKRPIWLMPEMSSSAFPTRI